MKKILMKNLGIFILCALCLPIFASCNNNGGDGSSDAGSDPSEAPENNTTVRIDETEYEIAGINASSAENGIYIYNSDLGELAAGRLSDDDKNFYDVVVVNGTVAAIYEKGTTAAIPESGCVLRFRGQGDPVFAVGDVVKSDAVSDVYLPPKYFRSGDIVVPIGHMNVSKTGEDTGFLYTENWYSASTSTNLSCTEIAVLNGKVVEIKRAGDGGGDTKIPEGGYVISVAQASLCEHKLRKLAVGDEAELVLSQNLYAVDRLSHIGNDKSRPADGIVILTDAEEQTPPGEYLTEVAVDASGRIIAVYTSTKGVKEIPKGGFVISASGNNAINLEGIASIGNIAVLNGKRNVCIISTPQTEFERLKTEFDALNAEFKVQTEKLSHIDFEAASKLVNEMSDKIAEAEKDLSDAAAVASAVKSLQTLAPECRNQLVPSVSVQDRTAWVTLGEHNYDGSSFIHYRTREEIAHTVSYAASLGLNTLIIDNIAAGYTLYPSKIEGMLRLPGYEDLDFIQAFSEECKDKGIRLIVMVHAFSCVDNKATYPENHFINIYKDKWLKSNKGRTSGPDNITTLDPADPVIQQFNLSVVKEIAENYDIYGIQVDYIRYPLPYYYQEHNYEDFGYNDSSVSGFVKKYGVDPATLKISDPRWEYWCKWRRDIISAYQKKLYQTIKSVDSNINVSFTCFADYNDRQKVVYQDVEKWAADGCVDALYPMIYGADTEYQLGYAKQILPVTENTDLILGVATYVRSTHESLAEQLIMPYELCAEGTSNFTLRYISICGYDETVRNAFRVKATPATASGSELANALISMLASRTETLGYASGLFAEKASESELASLAAVGNRLKEFAAELDDNTAEASLSTELSGIKADIISGKTAVPESIKDAFVHDIDYALGALN